MTFNLISKNVMMYILWLKTIIGLKIIIIIIFGENCFKYFTTYTKLSRGQAWDIKKASNFLNDIQYFVEIMYVNLVNFVIIQTKT